MVVGLVDSQTIFTSFLESGVVMDDDTWLSVGGRSKITGYIDISIPNICPLI